MTFDELEHAIRAACDVVDDDEVIVFGSQAILGQFPEAHPDLRQSVEADITPKNKPSRVDEIDGALGEGSTFHSSFGFYVHGVGIEAASLPDGWESRMVNVSGPGTRYNIGWCIEGHDLAASKLAAFREKDRDFVRVLLREDYVNADVLIQRILGLPKSREERDRLVTWVERTRKELASRRNPED